MRNPPMITTENITYTTMTLSSGAGSITIFIYSKRRMFHLVIFHLEMGEKWILILFEIGDLFSLDLRA